MATMQDALKSIENGEYRHIVSLSGGKDSTALAIYMSRKYPEIPTEYMFCDTGCELPETYEYLERLEALLGAKVQRLTAIDTLRIEKKATRNPFNIWLDEVYGGFLPNPRSRWCTRVLKIEPFERAIGSDKAFSYIGIRADENREGYKPKKPPVLSQQPNIIPIYPFKDDGLRHTDILELLEDSGLGLPEYYKWRSRSGCYFCFYQQIGEWKRLKENHAELFEKAKTYERVKNGKKYTWVDGRTLDEVYDLPGEYPLPEVDEENGCAICHL